MLLLLAEPPAPKSPAPSALKRAVNAVPLPAALPVPAEVDVAVDNETSPAHTMLTLRCRDRKGASTININEK